MYYHHNAYQSSTAITITDPPLPFTTDPKGDSSGTDKKNLDIQEAVQSTQRSKQPWPATCADSSRHCVHKSTIHATI